MKMKTKLLRWSVIVLLVLGTVVALFYAEENWRGAHAWKQVEAELKSKGEPLTMAELIPPPVPDSENIARLAVFQEAMDRETGGTLPTSSILLRLKTILSTPSLKLVPSTGPGKPAILADLQGTLDFFSKHQQEMSEIEKALSRPMTRWEVDYEKGFEVRLPQISIILDTCRILQLRALARLASGQSAAALEDVRLMRHLSGSLKDAFLIGYLVSVTCDSLTLQIIRQGLEQKSWNTFQLQELQNLVPGEDHYFKGYQYSLRWELVSGLDMMARLENGNSKDVLKIFNSNENPDSFERMMCALLLLRPKGWIDLDRVFYCEMMESSSFRAKDLTDLLRHSRACEEKIVQNAGSFWKRILTPLSFALFPAKKTLVGKTLEVQSLADMARVSCALERYRMAKGKIPLKLEDLVPGYLEQVPLDPVNGQPIHYSVKNEQDYLLYSVGLNEKDDGGYTSKKKELGDWVWPSRPGLVEVRDN